MPSSGRDGVFLSYRREDTSHLAGRVADRLALRFGADRVFVDVESLEPGLDFAEAIQQAADNCLVMLVLIGPRWSAAADPEGRRRLADPDDFVSLEVRTGLAHEQVRVVPVLVDGAPMPHETELPDGLRQLAGKQAVRLDHESFSSDLTALLDRVGSVVGERRPPRWIFGRPRRAAAAAAAVLLAVGAAGWTVLEDRKPSATCGAIDEDFDGPTGSSWSYENGGDPEVRDGQLRLTAADGADVRSDLQGAVTAPFLFRRVSGDFTVTTVISAEPRFSYQAAALLLYRDGGNYVRLERGFGDVSAIALEYALDGRHQKVHGPFTGENAVITAATNLDLRVRRRSAAVTASWRPSGATGWHELEGGARIAGDLRVGISVLNRSQPPNGDPEQRPFTAAVDEIRVECSSGE